MIHSEAGPFVAGEEVTYARAYASRLATSRSARLSHFVEVVRNWMAVAWKSRSRHFSGRRIRAGPNCQLRIGFQFHSQRLTVLTSGPVSLVCYSNGSWSVNDADLKINEPFHCEEVVCSQTEVPANGTVSFTSVNFGSKALLRCDQRFVLILLNGPQQRTSRSEGDWIGGMRPWYGPICVFHLKDLACPNRPSLQESSFRRNGRRW